MAVIFNSDKGGTAANSYASIADLDDYCAFDMDGDEIIELDGEVKEKILVTATRMIEQFTPLYDKADAAQALNFPVDTGGATLGDGFDAVKAACILQAIYLYRNNDGIKEAQAGAIQGVKTETIGPVSKSMTGFNPFTKWAPGFLALIAPWVDLDMRVHSRGPVTLPSSIERFVDALRWQ